MNVPPPVHVCMLELNLRAKPKALFPSHIIDNYLHIKCMVGSKAICTPVPENADEDWLVYFVHESGKLAAINTLLEKGWEKNENYGLDEQFVSLKQVGNEVNLIMTHDGKFYDRFITAMNICKKLNVTDKKTRIWVHDQLMKELDL
jgi:hypothetical protein